MTSSATLAALSAWIDAHEPNRERDPEAQLWGRCAKITEEAGEVITELVRITGQNPRKPAPAGSAEALERLGLIGLDEDLDDLLAPVVDELLDVAVTALAAVEHVTGNRGRSLELLDDKLEVIADRAGIRADA